MKTTAKSMTAEIIPSTDLMLQFPPDALESIGIKCGEKVSLRVDGEAIVISKLVPIEIELEDRDFLALAKQAHERDITFNDYVREILEVKLKEWSKTQPAAESLSKEEVD
jgi:hypothetical protein